VNSPGGKSFFYGYVIVAACFVVLYMLWGTVLNTLPIFLKPIAEDMGWGRGPFLVALIMGAIGTTVAAPIAGKMIDKIGARPVMGAGAIMTGLGLIAGSRIEHLWQLYLIFAVIGAGLMCATIIPCSLIISNWFISRRGAAMSGAFVGTSVGGMIMSPLAEWIIRTYSWKTAFAFSGTAILVIVLPVIFFFIRTHPSEVGLEPYGVANNDEDAGKDMWGVGVKEAFSLRVFWQIAAVMLIIGLVTGGVANNCVAYLTDLGHSSKNATYTWSLVMGAMILGKLSFGPAADRWGAKNAMAGACALLSASIVVLVFAKPYSVMMIFGVIYGFACGAPLILNALLTGEYLGMKNFGAIYGLLNITVNLGGSLGPAAAGFFYDSQGTYLPVFWFFSILLLAGVVVSLFIKPAPRNFGPADATHPAPVTH